MTFHTNGPALQDPVDRGGALQVNPVTGSGIIDQGATLAALLGAQLGSDTAQAGYLTPQQIDATGSSFIPTLGRQSAEAQALFARAQLAEQARGTDINAQLSLGSLAEQQRANTNAGALDLAGLAENQRTNTFGAQLGSAQLAEAQRLADAQYAIDVERFGLNVANANYQQRMGEAQMQFGVLSLLSSLRGPENAFAYNAALNNLGGGNPAQSASVDPFAEFRGLAQEFQYDPAALAGALTARGAVPQIGAAGALPSLQGAGAIPSFADLGQFAGAGENPFAAAPPTLAPIPPPAAYTPVAGGGLPAPAVTPPAAPPAAPPSPGAITAGSGGFKPVTPTGDVAADLAEYDRRVAAAGLDPAAMTGFRDMLERQSAELAGSASPSAAAPSSVAAPFSSFRDAGGDFSVSGERDIDAALAAAGASAEQLSVSPSTGKQMSRADVAKYYELADVDPQAAEQWLRDNGYLPQTAAHGGRFQGQRQIAAPGASRSNAGGAVRGQERATAVITGDHPLGLPNEELVSARNNPQGGAPIVDVTPLGNAAGGGPAVPPQGAPAPALAGGVVLAPEEVMRRRFPMLGAVPRAALGGSFSGLGAADNPLSFQTLGQQEIGQLPVFQKILGNVPNVAFAGTGLNTTLPGTNVQLGDQLNLQRFGNLAPSERLLLQGAFETPRASGGLGLDFRDILDRSRRAAPLGADIARLTGYGS
jgi:hypothetical protein